MINNNTSFNKTSMLLLPTVLVSSNKKEYPLELLKKSGFINAFIDDKRLKYSSFDWYNNKSNKFIYLLFKPKSLKLFSTDEEIYKEFYNWVDYYDLEDGHVMHVFKVPKKFEDDIDKFRLGQYSKFSEELKNSYINPFIKGIVYKYEKTRIRMSDIYGVDIPSKNEYLSIPKDSEEIYRYETITDLVPEDIIGGI